MIHVLATVELKPETREKFLKFFQENVPNVRAEKGCIRYEPTVDVDSGIPRQVPLRPNVVTVIEAWESIEALRGHLKTPHMEAYRENVKDLVERVSLQVLQSTLPLEKAA